jgi:glycosyltransferase involved in cell wall biosynthesis
MRKPGAGSNALFVTPEPPYPAIGGGALRSSSIFEYLRDRYEVDVVTFTERGDAISVPGARRLFVLKLPRHSRAAHARAWRNFSRYIRGAPPLVDRFSGFAQNVERILDGLQYDVAVVEHLWCAPYAPILRSRARRLVVDLHNIESELQLTSATAENWPVSAIFRRFAGRYRNIEREYLPAFDDVLVPSADDARRLREICRATVYPNALPLRAAPDDAEEHAIAFSGNLEYHPNIAAVRFFASRIWPRIRAQRPNLEWRLIGMNPHAVRKIVDGINGVRVIGPVPDAIAALARAKVVIAPLLSGSGTRFKILEAWAARRAVVSTTIGAEGLCGKHGESLCIADDPDAFANAVIQLVDSPEERRRLGGNGRGVYLERYTTEAAWRELERMEL